MKKKFKNMTWMLAAALVMVSCSDSLNEGSGNGNSNEYIGDKGYVNIGINLPTTKGNTRAFEGYDDGVEEEYKVSNVIIALFYGSNENEATCRNAFKIDGDDFMATEADEKNITTYSVTGVRMIEAPDANENVYALALINAPTKFGIINTPTVGEDTGDAVLSTGLSVDGILYEGKLNGLLNDAIECSNIKGTDGFFMTNAAIAIGGDVPSTSTAQVLAPISVYNSKDIASGEAKNNPIYVERAAAKVAVTVNGADNTLTVTDKYPHYAGAKVKFEKWNLQNTNKNFYPVRKVDGFDYWKNYIISSKPNRFVGTLPNPYRIFWAVDPNYETTDPSVDLNILTTGEEPVDMTGWYDMANSGYCAENTTNADVMEFSKNLTSVLLKATFTPNGSSDGDNFFIINNVSAIYDETEFLEWATRKLLNGNNPASGTLSINSGASSGIITTAALVQNLIYDGESPLEQSKAELLLTEAGGNIKFYENGVTYYYAAVIKHFGDDETPYEESTTGENTYTEEKHLGRYGVVRNTSYVLNINSVSGPGEPVIPEVPITPPDKEESYINCEINVLSWAKRSQNVDL